MNWNIPSLADQVAYDLSEVFAAGLAMHQIANTAYPIAHVNTMRPYKIPRSEVAQFAPQAWLGIERLGLFARFGKPAFHQEAVQPSLHGRMAMVAVSEAPPISMTTGTSSPEGAPRGIVTLIW